MTACAYCHGRKGKRPCPALGGRICSICCGTHRLREIACPSGCVHLPRAGHATHEAYVRAGTALRRYADERRGWAAEATWALLVDDLPVASWEEALVGGWLTLGYVDASGQRLVDIYLRERARQIGADEAAALRCLRDESWFSLFEVTEVRLREGLHLVDLLIPRTLFVREVLGTLTLDPGALLLGWVVRLEGHDELSGADLVVSELDRDRVLSLLRDELRAARSQHPERRDEELLRRSIPAVHRLLRSRRGPPLGVEDDAVFEALLEGADAACGVDEQMADAEPVAAEVAAPEPAPSGATHGLPPLPHEMLRAIVPGLREVVESVARRMRASSGGAASVWGDEEVGNIAEVRRFLEAYATEQVLGGWSRAAAVEGANILGHHVFVMAGFEARYRKTFWVDEALAFQLQETDLDIRGEFLNLPFPSCAIVFTDDATLRLVTAVLQQNEDYGRRPPIRIAAAYLTRVPAPGDAIGLDVSLLTHCGDGRWPYLLSRSLLIHPEDRLDAILESKCPDVGSRDAIFTSHGLKDVVRLVLNAVLYATTSHLEAPLLRAPGEEPHGEGRGHTPFRRTSAEDVYYLPGKIPISRVRQLRAIASREAGHRLFSRFMVRGHWRRAAESWSDKRLRWIEPYWKGPDESVILEREYKLKP